MQTEERKEEFQTIIFYPTTTRTFDECSSKMRENDSPLARKKQGGNRKEKLLSLGKLLFIWQAQKLEPRITKLKLTPSQAV